MAVKPAHEVHITGARGTGRDHVVGVVSRKCVCYV